MEQNEQLQDKLRVLLAITRECLDLKEQTDVLSSPWYDDFWCSLDAVEGDLTSFKSSCII